MALNDDFRVSVCICTRNRPEELRRALASVQESTIRPHEIIVSDDSTDRRTEELISAGYPAVKYVGGPRKGLCANRNVVLRSASGSHLLFLDDDSVLGKRFLETIHRTIESCDPAVRTRLIVSGAVEEGRDHRSVLPHDQVFLGFQSRPYRPGEPYRTVVIGSTVFPQEVFDTLRFDEQLIYGSDEVDLTTRAIARGFRIALCAEAVNQHYPSPVNRDYYAPFTEASRLYVTFKRYFFTEHRRLKGLAFFCLAALHTVAHAVKAEGAKGALRGARTVRLAARFISNHLRATVRSTHS